MGDASELKKWKDQAASVDELKRLQDAADDQERQKTDIQVAALEEMKRKVQADIDRLHAEQKAKALEKEQAEKQYREEHYNKVQEKRGAEDLKVANATQQARQENIHRAEREAAAAQEKIKALEQQLLVMTAQISSMKVGPTGCVALEWTVDDVAKWAVENKFDEAPFRAQDVDGPLLLELEVSDLEEMGFSTGLQRKRIIAAIKKIPGAEERRLGMDRTPKPEAHDAREALAATAAKDPAAAAAPPSKEPATEVTTAPTAAAAPPAAAAPAKEPATEPAPAKASPAVISPPSTGDSGSAPTLTLEELKDPLVWKAKGVDANEREMCLADEEFEKVFGVDKEAFRKMPEWQRKQQKRKNGLF